MASAGWLASVKATRASCRHRTRESMWNHAASVLGPFAPSAPMIGAAEAAVAAVSVASRGPGTPKRRTPMGRASPFQFRLELADGEVVSESWRLLVSDPFAELRLL